MKTLEAWYGVPPDRDDPVVQLFLAPDGPQWGEVRLSEGGLVLEVFASVSEKGVLLPIKELREVLRIAENQLRNGEQ